MNTKVKERYEKLSTDRLPYLQRARDCAKLTIPSLIPPEGANSSTVYRTPYQGLGARGVNNLTSKLLLTLIPADAAFFKMIADLSDLKLQEDEAGELKTKVEEAFGKIEQRIMSEIEARSIRVPFSEALKHLVVAGNVLLYTHDQDKKKVKVFHLDRYVCKRDAMGDPIEIIVKESRAASTIPMELLQACSIDQNVINKNDNIDIYTWIVRTPDEWEICQEINGTLVPESYGTYPIDACPWNPMRFTRVDGEDYGRGYIEEYLGDLISCEELTKAIVQGSAAAAKILFMVNSNGTTKVRSLTQAENMDVIQGNAGDVTVLQLDKYADFNIAFQTLGKIEQRLALAFLLNTAVQRSGERVTAEEIRYMAGELKDALGATYAVLTEDLQWLVKVLLHQLSKEGKLPALPKEAVKITIVTGLEGLARGHELNKLANFLQYVEPLGPETIPTYINVDNYLTRVGTALAIDTKGLVKTAAQVQQEQLQQQQLAMAQQLAPAMIQNKGNGPAANANTTQ
jgi:hypothetical protein